MIITNLRQANFDRVDSRIWVGGFESVQVCAFVQPPFSMLVLCARELQPEAKDLAFKGKIIRPAFDDKNPITANEALRAIDAANAVADAVEKKQNVLVTCAAGLNRSALVAALAMVRLHPNMKADNIIAQIRKARSRGGMNYALFNDHFVEMIQKAGA
jgi:predicted protein tyrosine phosphatase